MFKVRLIAAAVLASVMMPTVVSAKFHDERIKIVMQTRKDVRDRRNRIRDLLRQNPANAQDLQRRLADLNAKLAELNDRLNKLKEGSASA